MEPTAAKAEKQDPSKVQVKRRMYVGGLSTATTQADLRERFQSFGKVTAVDLPMDKFSGGPRGFAYVSLETNEAKWNQCLSILNNANWKGSKLKIHEAKPNFTERLAKEKAEPAPVKKQPKVPPPKRLDDDMSLITEENYSKHKGWKKGKFNVPVAVMRCFLRYRRKNFLVYDPTKLKNHIRRFTKEAPDVPLNQLTWKIPEPSWKKGKEAKEHVAERASKTKDSDKQHHEEKEVVQPLSAKKTVPQPAGPTPVVESVKKPAKSEPPAKVKLMKDDPEQQIRQAKAAGFLDSDSEESWNGSDTEITEPVEEKPQVASIAEKVSKEMSPPAPLKKGAKIEDPKFSEERRLNSLKQKDDEKKAKLESIQKALQAVDSKVTSKNHISFDDDEEGKEDQTKDTSGKSTRPPPRTNWMDSDDDEDGEEAEQHDFHVNEVFADEATSKDLMKMQMKFGDSRFRLTDLFIDKPNKPATDAEPEDTENSEEASLKKQLEAERNSAMGVLSSLLGPQKVAQTQQAVWKEPAFYDPNNPASKKFEKEAKAAEPRKRHEPTEEDLTLPLETSMPVSTQAPEVSDKRFFQVQSTYHDLFATPTTSGFSILGGPTVKPKTDGFSFGFLGDADDDQSPALGKRKREDEVAESGAKGQRDEVYRISMDPEETRARLQKTPLFFFHLQNPDVKGCATRLAIIDKFQRVGTLDNVVRGWEEYRSNLTQEYKRKHKSTTRKKVRMSRKRKAL